MKNQMLAILTILSLCLGFLMACSSSGGGSSDSDNMTVAADNQTSADNTTTDMGGSGVPNDNTTSTGDNSTGGASDTINLTGPIVDLQGTWKTSCVANDDIFQNRSLQVSGRDFAITFDDYTDAACEVRRGRTKSSFANLSIGDNVTFSDNTTGYQFMAEWDQQIITPLDNGATQSLMQNLSIATCRPDITTLEVGTSVDITGKSCGDFGNFPTKGTSFYSAYRLTGDKSLFQYLTFGDGSSDNGTYPTVTDFEWVFAKESSDEPNLTGPTAELQGTWISSCLSDGYVNVLKKIDVSGDSVNFEWSYYEETDNQTCSTLRDILAFSTDDISITDNTTMTTLSATLKKFTLTPFGETESYNRHIRCGFSDWETGATRDVAGLGIEDCDFPAAGTPFTFQYALDEGSLDFTDLTIDTRTYTKQ